MPKKALLVLAEGFEEIEAVAPIDILRRAGVEVTVAGLSASPVKSARGLGICADVDFDQAMGEFDALILPGGGGGAQNLAASAGLKTLIVEMFKKGKWICAICASPTVVLFPAGILRGKSATCFQGMEAGFDASVRYVDRKVVVDGNVITSKGPATAVEFALAVAGKLAGEERSEKIRRDILA